MKWHILATLLLAAIGAELLAQSAVVRPQRLVHRFDFEERQLGNFEEMPMHWYPIGRSAQTPEPGFHRQPLHRELIGRLGYPRHTQIRFDTRHAIAGEHSFYLGLDGGNAGAYLEVGTLPAVPGSDYMIIAHVRTGHLERAGAYVTAYFIDADGERIDASVYRSPAIRSNDAWLPVTVHLTGEHPDAAWIGMELELRQPTPNVDHPLRGQQIVLPDVRGTAWFDDITIWQIPHLEVGTQSRTNLITGSQSPRLSATVRDLTGRRMQARMTVYDHLGAAVDERQLQVGDGAPPRWTWEPELPGYGWYLIDLIVHDRDPADAGGSPVGRDEPIARTVGAFLWMPDEQSMLSEDASRFSLLAEDVSARQMRMLPRLLTEAGLRRAVVSAWDRETTRLNIDDRVELLDELVQSMAPGQQDLGISLHPLPTELLERTDNHLDRALEVFAYDEEAWLPYLTPVLLRHGPRVQRWHLGTPTQAEAFYEPELPRLLERIERQFLALAPRPRLVLPWSLEQMVREDVSASSTFVYDVPPGIAAERLADHLEGWGEHGRSGLLVLRSRPADEVAHRHRVTDLALRMVYAWAEQPGGLALSRPWTGSAAREPELLPDPLLGVYRNVAHRLAGRRVVGELPIGEGLRCLILDGPAGGMLVAWNEQAPASEGRLHMDLGGEPTVADVWGNRQGVSRQDGRHVVELARTPRFIEGIDPELALFRASYRVTEPFVESRQEPHQRTLELTNPWPRTISGHLQMVGPEGWRISPARHHFSIAAGETLRLPIEMQFPIVEVAGPKRLEARFDFTADRQYEVDMGAPMELGLSDVAFDATLTIEPGDQEGKFDAVATCILTNTGEAVLALYVFANLRDHPRQERIVARLAPGESVVRRFRFQGVNEGMEEGRPVRVGVREANGPAILNQLLQMKDVRPTEADVE
ncbi:hypothetical protein ACERK3_01345 [Phycisphaerales bacterium AB-hyl4]|uniref:Uncharacterized protein n=1 Tax=Natronomicrosphaera hydrolytica TaxID=3242702 RepID=A0ABV4U230_9BACT